jgi:ribonuclease HII
MSTWNVGIDEAGRGPLAGPVAVGAFAVDEAFDASVLVGIRDSKVLTLAKRESWYAILTNTPHARWAVALTDASVIDTRGIQYAIRSALSHALNELGVPDTAHINLDGGLRAPDSFKNQTTIIRGDVTEPLISAGAILAKVTRDRYMVQADTQYPGYGFAIHKGYGTVAHRKALRALGLCDEHRKTFIHLRST